MSKKLVLPEDIRRINDAWLGIDEEHLINPLLVLDKEDPERYYKGLTYLLTNTEYIHFLCKYIFNVDILPFQGVLLQEMWNHRFPMLIGTRGLGKSFIMSLYALVRALVMPSRKIVIAGAGFRQSKFLHDYMEGIWNRAPVLRDLCESSSGPKREVDMYKFNINSSVINCIPIGDGSKIRGLRANDILCLSKDTLVQTDKGLIEIQNYLDGGDYKIMNKEGVFEKPNWICATDPTDVYEVITRSGFSFKCSSVHQVMTGDGWKRAIDLTTDDYLEIDTNDYFPADYQSYEGLTVNEDIGWLLGILISEGSVETRNAIKVTNTDYDLIERIKNRTKFNWKEYPKEAYVDKRGFNCKKSWRIDYNDVDFRSKLYKLGLDYSIHLEKKIPSSILRSPKSVIIEFLKGVFEGDGTAFQYADNNRGGKCRTRIAYYSSSKKLCTDLQTLLLKFNVYGSLASRSSKLSKNPQWMLQINGESAYILSNLLTLDKWNMDLSYDDFRYLKPSIRKKGERFLVSTIRADKNTYIGSFGSEEECIRAFNEYWANHRKCYKVKSVTKLAEKEVLYDFNMPSQSFIGGGFVQHNCDEFSSHNIEIFENVIAGFAAVSSSPAENVKIEASKKKAKELGVTIDQVGIKETTNIGNQIIISGTAYYDFNHFATYWRRWKSIIKTGGDKRKLKEVFKGEDPPDSFNWRDYCIMRIPVDLLPTGFMDEAQIARSKATIHSGIYSMEFGSVFCKDSTGFFKRSLLEACTTSDIKPVIIRDEEICFDPTLYGRPDRKYVLGVDVASEVDNFAIVVVECHESHRRIVHCWTTNRAQHKERVKLGLTDQQDFYVFCARKIRDLMKSFHVEHISMDAQGGGIGVYEALHDEKNLRPGELQIWPIIEEKEKDTDGHSGLHILEMCQFSRADWLSEANHGLRKDFEDRVLLFPRFDGVSLGLAAEDDIEQNRLYDTLEDCVLELEELKNELCLIEVTRTPSGREHWDTPELKINSGRKQRMKKDRYSALMMANMAARTKQYVHFAQGYSSYGGFAENSKTKEVEYIGPSWFTEGMKGVY